MNIRSKPAILLSTLFWVGFIVVGMSCRQLDPGADPLVVNVERFLTSADGTFKFVLKVDQQDRTFWRSNAPAFHAFAESLRQPTPYPPGEITHLLPRYRVYLLSLDDVKAAYQRAKTDGNSNALYTAFATLKAIEYQGAAWLTIVTNTPSN